MNYIINIFIIIFICLYIFFYLKDDSYKVFEEMGIKTKNNYISLKLIREQIKINNNLEFKDKLKRAYNNRIRTWVCLFVNLFLFMHLIFF